MKKLRLVISTLVLSLCLVSSTFGHDGIIIIMGEEPPPPPPATSTTTEGGDGLTATLIQLFMAALLP